MNRIFQFDEYNLNKDGTFTRTFLNKKEHGTLELLGGGSYKLMQEGKEDRVVKITTQ